MTIQIYNTLNKKKEIFKPIEAGKIKIYVCGPTVYDVCHIGHARSTVFFDVVTKYFKSIGYQVKYVRNFTDIDDKIINRSLSLGITCQELARKNIDSFHNDMKMLNVKKADIEPYVTKNIDIIIDMIKILIKKNFAYQSNGDIYFSVNKSKKYGQLAGRNKKELILKSRTTKNQNKNYPLDFALWKSAKNNEPFWESPWGNGRPGWHIECSAMINKILGKTIDIHGGGEDLIFPHHENEKIQSELAFEKPLAKYWMHNGLININNEKMSKSLNNWKSIQEITKIYHPEVVRLFLLSSHYRSPINFSKHHLDSSKKALTRVYNFIKTNSHILKFQTNNQKENNKKEPIWETFCAAMNDDFNTAKSIAILFNSIKNINKLIFHQKQKTNKLNYIEEINNNIKQILKIGDVLGILKNSPEQFLSYNNINKKNNINSNEIEKMLLERSKARKNKEWAKADSIRDSLKEIHIEIQDKPNKTKWKIVD